MKKIVRNMSTAESRIFWAKAQRSASEVQQWPEWKRAGINVAQVRGEALGSARARGTLSAIKDPPDAE